MSTQDEIAARAKELALAWHKIFTVSNQNWARLTIFRHVASGAEGYDAGILAAKDMAEELRAEPGPPEPFHFLRVIHLDFVKKLETLPREELIRAVDGAAIVFAHSILDNIVTALCELAMMADPGKTEEVLALKKVALADVKTSSYLSLLNDEIKVKTQELSRESLGKRLKFLYSFCPEALDVHVFDTSKLDEFDRLRQDVVHKARFDLIPGELESLLDFAQSAGLQLGARFLLNYPEVWSAHASLFKVERGEVSGQS